MNFLKEIGISNETISVLNEICLPIEKSSAESNKEFIFSSIEYLKSIGIDNKTIEDILVFDYHYLMPGADMLKKSVDKNGVDIVVKKINEDLDNLTYLLDF